MAKALNTKVDRTTKAAPPPEAFSLIASEKLLAIYSAMVKCRMLEQRATLLFQQGKLSSDLHASSGREASAAAIATELGQADALSIAPGDWLPAFIKGVTLENLFRSLASSSTPTNSRQPSVPADMEYKRVLFTGDEAQRIAAIRDRAESSPRGAIVAAYLPDGPTLPRPWHGVLTAATSKRLPIVFVRYSVTENTARETSPGRKTKNPQALIHGVPAIAVDALDAVAVYRVAYEAIIRARQGRGATLLECSFPAAINPANNSLNRSSSPDPVSAMESYLIRKGIEPEQHNRQTVDAFNRDLELATRFLDQ